MNPVSIQNSAQRQAILAVAEGLDFHVQHMHQVFPELILDLCSHGPIEKAIEAMNGQSLQGRDLRVNEAMERAPRRGGQGGGGGRRDRW